MHIKHPYQFHILALKCAIIKSLIMNMVNDQALESPMFTLIYHI